jgi:hypothetical protein
MSQLRLSESYAVQRYAIAVRPPVTIMWAEKARID